MRTAAKIVAAMKILRTAACTSGARRPRWAAARAGGILGDANRPHCGREAVEQVQLSSAIVAEAGDGADRLKCGEAAGDAGHRAKHAKLRACVAILGVEGVPDEAAIAGPAFFPA